MNRLATQQRKLAYLMAIIILLIPIIYLGAPSDGRENGFGGKLAQMRNEYELGETSLGNVDPASSTMNLVLLGMRGIAVSGLWYQAVQQKDQKDWANLRTTVDSIVMLQPHFRQVWEFQGWNLAYNVSAEWDGVSDRYYWVKEGAKFLMRGTKRNHRYPELPWEVGRIMGAKVGRADEWKQFRQFFLDDPNLVEGGVDPEINPEGKDNYLVAKDWFTIANEMEAKPGISQSRLMPEIFRGYPVRSQLDYAGVLNREGIFDEVSREAWSTARTEMTQDWGQERYMTPAGLIQLEANDEVLKELSEIEGNIYPLDQKQRWVLLRQNVTNYRYWRTRAEVEGSPEMTEAHRLLYLGRRQFLDEQDPYTASETLYKGLALMEGVITNYSELASEDNLVEECIKSIVLWSESLKSQGKQVPAEYPLREIFDNNPVQAQETINRFQRFFGG